MRVLTVAALLLTGLGLSGCFNWQCDATSCADGCCQRDGTCAVGGVQDKCGLGGAACAVCPAAQTCTQGACVAKCDAKSCPGGCCDPTTYACVMPPSQSTKACGTPGTTCKACATSESCGNAGCAPKCTANNCGAGCCMPNGTCLTFASQGIYNCGKGGQACSSCAGVSSSCSQGACCLPANTTCSMTSSSMCCQPTSCVPPYQGASSGSCL